MKLINEIRKLPNLCYVFDGSDMKWHMVMLGGGSAQVISDTNDYPNYKIVDEIQIEMESIYEKDEKTIYDIARFKELYNQMLKYCIARKESSYTIDDQELYINQRSDEEKQQIEKQIKMYKTFMKV